MEALDYFVLILVVLAYLGWFLARDTDTQSHDTQPRI
jgi:lipopolysaccharide biosynthesis regulator YciM